MMTQRDKDRLRELRQLMQPLLQELNDYDTDYKQEKSKIPAADVVGIYQLQQKYNSIVDDINKELLPITMEYYNLTYRGRGDYSNRGRGDYSMGIKRNARRCLKRDRYTKKCKKWNDRFARRSVKRAIRRV